MITIKRPTLVDMFISNGEQVTFASVVSNSDIYVKINKSLRFILKNCNIFPNEKDELVGSTTFRIRFQNKIIISANELTSLQ